MKPTDKQTKKFLSKREAEKKLQREYSKEEIDTAYKIIGRLAVGRVITKENIKQVPFIYSVLLDALKDQSVYWFNLERD